MMNFTALEFSVLFGFLIKRHIAKNAHVSILLQNINTRTLANFSTIAIILTLLLKYRQSSQ